MSRLSSQWKAYVRTMLYMRTQASMWIDVLTIGSCPVPICSPQYSMGASCTRMHPTVRIHAVWIMNKARTIRDRMQEFCSKFHVYKDHGKLDSGKALRTYIFLSLANHNNPIHLHSGQDLAHHVYCCLVCSILVSLLACSSLTLAFGFPPNHTCVAL